MIDNHARLLVSFHVGTRGYDKACRVALEYRAAARRSASSRLVEKANALCLELVKWLFQCDQTDKGMWLGRQIVSAEDDPGLCGPLGSEFLWLARESGHREFLMLGFEAISRAIVAVRQPPIHGLYAARAATHALLGEIGEALADYDEAIRQDPDDKGAALSRAEVQIWAGRYAEAQHSLEVLLPRLRDPEELSIHAWLMCHALNLQGEDFSGYQKVLTVDHRPDRASGFGFRDIETYLQKLDPAVTGTERIRKAWLIQELLLGSRTSAQRLQRTMIRQRAARSRQSTPAPAECSAPPGGHTPNLLRQIIPADEMGADRARRSVTPCVQPARNRSAFQRACSMRARTSTSSVVKAARGGDSALPDLPHPIALNLTGRWSAICRFESCRSTPNRAQSCMLASSPALRLQLALRDVVAVESPGEDVALLIQEHGPGGIGGGHAEGMDVVRPMSGPRPTRKQYGQSGVPRTSAHGSEHSPTAMRT